MKQLAVSNTQDSHTLSWIYVLHAQEHLNDCFLYEQSIPGIKLITGMADLIDCHGTLSGLWIDARITWRLPGVSMFPTIRPKNDLQVCIYNAEYLAPEICGMDQKQLRFLKGGIYFNMLKCSEKLSCL